MLTISSAKLTGTPGVTGWTQVHEFAPDDPEKLKARGKLFAVVATKRVEEGVESVITGRELLTRLHEEYFGSTDTKPFNALSNAVQKVIAEFKESWGDVEIAACAFVGDIVYSAAGGGGGVTISRGGSLGTILESQEATVSASGYPKEEDVMLLATKSFYNHVPQGVIKAGLSLKTPQEAIEMVAPSVHESGDIGNLGAVVIRFGSDANVMAAPILPAPPVFSGPGQYLRGFRKKVTDIFSTLSKKLPERRIYVNSPADTEVTSQNKKLTFSVALVLLVILVVSIGFGIRQKRINDTKESYESVLAQAVRDVDEAINLAGVSPERSRELFVASEGKLKEIEVRGIKDPNVVSLRKKIDDSRAAILGEYRAPSELFLDLSLLSSGFKADTVTVSGGTIFVLDKGGKKVVSVEAATKKSKVVAGPNVIDEALDLASYEDRAFILASDGIYELDNGKTKVVEKSWDGDVRIAAFAANMYVLDIPANAIYRFAGSGTSFGDKQNWLAAGTRADFSDAKAWVIDGSVYVLFPNSKIAKFSLGSPQNFSVSGIFPEIGTIDAIYAGADNQDVYLLDRAGGRVVVVDKKGQYKAQYIDTEIGNTSSLVVSEADKKIILVTGDKLLSIELKHI